MPGIPTHFRILDLTLKQLAAEGLGEIVANVENNIKWARLGSIGPLLLDFAPLDPSENPYVAIWQRIFNILGDDEATKTMGLLSAYTNLKAFLDSVQSAADLENSDALAAVESQFEMDKVTDTLESLVVRINNLLKDSLISIQDLKPPVEVAGSAPAPASRD